MPKASSRTAIAPRRKRAAQRAKPGPALLPPSMLMLEHHEEGDDDTTALARTDMLDNVDSKAAPEDAEERSSPFVVTSPAVGFFVAGSSIPEVNGVYVQQSPPQYDEDEPGVETLLFYCHVDNPWTLECVERRGAAAWALVDETGQERFRQPGGKLVPGAGVRWHHAGQPPPPGARALGMRVEPHAVAQGASDVEFDEDELPWQVIAILDRHTLQQVCAGADAHKARVRAEAEAKAAHAGLPDVSDGAGGSASVASSAAAAAGDAAPVAEDHDELAALAAEPDHYKVLGVAPDATDKAIVQAYRMASLKYHPDRRGGSTAAFQRVQLAYSTLADEERRRTYDAGGPPEQGGAGSAPCDATDERWRDEFWPFGDPFVHRRKLEAERRRKAEAKSAKASSRAEQQAPGRPAAKSKSKAAAAAS